MASLTIIDGEGKGQTFQIPPTVAHIGRNEGNEIVIAHPSISGTHCEIARRGDLLQIHDLGSTNGTKVNGESVRIANVYRNDIITLGSVPLELQGEDVPQSAGPQLEGLDIVPRTTIVITPNSPTTKLPVAGFKPRRDAKMVWILLFATLSILLVLAAIYFAISWLS